MKPNTSCEQVPTEFLLPFLEELLNEGKSVNMTVTGNSMMPLLRDRVDSVVLVRPEKIRKFDIVLYVQENGKAILHRIVKCRHAGYMIVGDNQFALDGPIGRNQIKATVPGFYRDGRYISCRTWWCRLYAFVWGYGRIFRRPLLPLVRFLGRIVKRMEIRNEVDS